MRRQAPHTCARTGHGNYFCGSGVPSDVCFLLVVVTGHSFFHRKQESFERKLGSCSNAGSHGWLFKGQWPVITGSDQTCSVQARRSWKERRESYHAETERYLCSAKRSAKACVCAHMCACGNVCLYVCLCACVFVYVCALECACV